jgi:hypothetical protein
MSAEYNIQVRPNPENPGKLIISYDYPPESELKMLIREIGVEMAERGYSKAEALSICQTAYDRLMERLAPVVEGGAVQ